MGGQLDWWVQWQHYSSINTRVWWVTTYLTVYLWPIWWAVWIARNKSWDIMIRYFIIYRPAYMEMSYSAYIMVRFVVVYWAGQPATTVERVCRGGWNDISRDGRRNRLCFSQIKMAIRRGGHVSHHWKWFCRGGWGVACPLKPFCRGGWSPDPPL